MPVRDRCRFTCDKNDNRTSWQTVGGSTISYTYDAANKMLTAGNSTFTYDDAGNTLTETNGSVVTTYTWDYLNRLTQWSKTGHTTQSYVYNADGMRVRVVPSGGTATDFLLDGIEIAEEIAGATVTSYVGPGLISEISGTTRTIYHADGLGSTRAMSDSSQVVSESSTYDAYGNAVAAYGTAPSFGYAGQYRYYTDATGLHYLKARYYDPVAGRFLSKDPIGYNGERNLYQYARSRPTSLVDPSGRIAWAPIIGVIGIFYGIWEGANWVVDWYICGLALQSWYECSRRAREVYPNDCQRKWKFCEGQMNDVINSCPETTWREYAGNPIYGPTL